MITFITLDIIFIGVDNQRPEPLAQ